MSKWLAVDWDNCLKCRRHILKSRFKPVSKILGTVSVSELSTHNFCVGDNLASFILLFDDLLHLPDKTAEEDREYSLGEEFGPLFPHVFRNFEGRVWGAKHIGDPCSEPGDLTAEHDHFQVLRGVLLLNALVERLDPRAGSVGRVGNRKLMVRMKISYSD